MNTETLGAARLEFPLRGSPQALELTAEGLHHPTAPPARGYAFTPWSEITHVAASARALWIGATRSVYVISRNAFVQHGAPELAARAMLERIASRPGGGAQLARMAEIERLAQSHQPVRATWGLVIACLLVFVLEILFGDDVYLVGKFSPLYAGDGDLWRLITANLLHAFPGFPLHLVLNMLGALVFGSLVERPLGSARTVCVMFVSGIGSMAATWVASPQQDVIGASGVVFGLVGSFVWLELRRADALPAWWRVPRRSLWIFLVLNVALGFLPFIAAASHYGGLLAGALTTAAVAGDAPRRRAAPAWVGACSALSIAVVGLSLVQAGNDLTVEGDVLARYTARLARIPDVSATEKNNTAWMIAIAPDSSPELQQAALELAERAVEETERQDPHILDTLAELQFLLGFSDEAVRTIDEAIALDPGESYYQEQRKRFTGERAADDRPLEPGLLPDLDAPEEPAVTI